MADKYTMVDPVTVDGVEISAVDMPKIKGRHIREVGRIDAKIKSGELDEADASAEMIETIFGLPKGTFDEMSFADIEALQERFEMLFPTKAPTK